MSFASDQLYKGYLRKNMPTIVSTVKPREIMPHLPCLTDHDKENIEAKREICGNYDSMVVLLDCLKRRENWPEQFIGALEECGYNTIADKIRSEYNALLGGNNSTPSSPPTTVIRAHVHPAPSAVPVSVPESVANGQDADTTPAVAETSPEPAAILEAPVQPQVPQIAEAQVPEAVPPPEPVAEPKIEVVVAPATPTPTPPPSPEITHTQADTTEVYTHQEPEENSESDIQDVSTGENGVITDQVLIDSVANPDVITITTTIEVIPPRSPSPTQMDSEVTEGDKAALPVLTPTRQPVQDTSPSSTQPVDTPEPPAIEVVEIIPEPEPTTTTTTSPLPVAAEMDAPLSEYDDEFMSKPDVLTSVLPQSNDTPTMPAPSSPEAPYSGDSGRLEYSDAEEDSETSAYVPACSALSSTVVNTDSALPCQENGIINHNNEPEENHYESPSHFQSSEVQVEEEEEEEVLVHMGHTSGEPCILNLDGQSEMPQAPLVNGDAPKEFTSEMPISTNTADPNLNVNSPPCSENHHPCEPQPPPAVISPDLEVSKDEKASSSTPTNTKYFVAAAGVGVCAMLMAWRYKH